MTRRDFPVPPFPSSPRNGLWKVIFEQVVVPVTGRISFQQVYSTGGALSVPLPNMGGKKIRVTIEEEIGECCLAAYESRSLGSGHNYCPTCGRKL